jgi:UDP-N-acetylmuramoylalanine--D-glutamate ligase
MKIAIAGFGVEGQASYRYYAKDLSNDITIFDENPDFIGPEGVVTMVGPNVFEKLRDYDLVLRSPPIAPSRIFTNGKIWSGTNEFMKKCPAPIVGVTGTKGKGTTASMITSILEAAGRKAWLVGNIGKPAIDVLPEIDAGDIVVYEMSSFQLWDSEQSPHVAVVLPIEPDHLNVHADMEDYVSAKGRIHLYQKQGDLCIYYPNNIYSRRIAESNTAAETQPYTVKEGGGVYVKDGSFYAGEQIICSLDVMQVPGAHNVEDASAAISVALYLGIDHASIERGMQLFKGLPHRIEFVREKDDVEYYNDSFSSAPGATIAAIKSFTQSERIIIGGIDKGAHFDDMIATIKAARNIREIILIGEIRHSLQAQLLAADVLSTITVLEASTMKEVVQYTASQVKAGEVVILSPACASFDMFRDFYDRGDQFRALVNAL